MRTITRWMYAASLALCPREFRADFGPRMRHDFERLLEDSSSGRARLRLALHECGDVLAAAWRTRFSGSRASDLGSIGRPSWRSRQALDDLRFAARALAARPGFTAVSVLTLALGIGSATIVFSVVDKVVVQPLPYPDSERLVWLWADDLSRGVGSRFPATPADFVDWRARSTSFVEMVASRSRSVVVTGGPHPERLVVAEVTDGTFPLLGVTPLVGAVLSADSAPTDLVLAHATWQLAFGADPDVVGQRVLLDGVGHTIVGVTPAGFRHPSTRFAAGWRPLRFGPADRADRARRSLAVLGRLEAGLALPQAQEEMRALGESLAAAFPATNESWGVYILQIKEIYLQEGRRMYVLLSAAVGLVLLIACTNLAGLVLARGAARRTELDLRLALGATYGRIVRLLVAEGVIVAVGGAAVGLAIAAWSLDGILSLAPAWPSVLRETTITGRGLAFVGTVAAASLVAFGVFPALGLSRQSPHSVLAGAARTAGASVRDLRVRRALVVAQLGLAVVLLIGASLLMRSVANIITADNGFNVQGVVTARVLADVDDRDARSYFETVLERAERLPGVQAAALTDAAPMDGTGDWVRVFVDGERRQEERALGADYRRVSPEYFAALGIERTAGRLFTDQEDSGDAVAVVNEDFARRFLGDRDPLGARIALAPSMGDAPTDQRREWRIVGVVETVQEWGPTSFVIPMIYVPFGADPNASMSLLLRTDAPAETLVAPLRSLVREVGNSPVYQVRTLASYFYETYATQRFVLALLGIFAALAILLAGVGLYGVMAYNVVQRRREIGVRVALGAQRGDVLRLMLGQGGRLAAAAVLIGLAGAIPIARGLSTLSMGRLLVDVAWFDPAAFVTVPVFVAATALLASWFPARRAARVDPVTALRSEA